MRKPLVFAPLLLELVLTEPAHADPAGFNNYGRPTATAILLA
jgi:hypothetical protein